MAVFLAIFTLVVLAACIISSVGLVEDSVRLYNQAVASASHEEALRYYQAALAIDWEFPQAHQNIGGVYRALGDLPKSLEHYKLSALFAHSDEFRASVTINVVKVEMLLLGVLDNNHLSRWMSMVDGALQQLPSSDLLHLLQANLLNHQGERQRATEKYQQIVELFPAYQLAWLELGNQHFRDRQFARARRCYHRALELASKDDSYNNAITCYNLAQNYREDLLLDEALQYIQIAVSFASSTQKEALLSATLAIKGIASDWKELEELEQYLQQVVLIHQRFLNSDPARAKAVYAAEQSVDPYTALLMRYNTPSMDLFVGAQHCTAAPAFFTADRVKEHRAALDASPSKGADRALRIGYLSHDWRNHAMGPLTSYIASRRSTALEVFCISYGPDDQSAVRRFLEQACQHFYDARLALNDYDVARYIFEHMQLDILVDLTSLTYNNRIAIAQLKPAPLLVNYLGYPGSTGCEGFDFTIVDRHVAPADYVAGQQVFSEKLVFMPHCYQSNNMPVDVGPLAQNRQTNHFKSLHRLNACVFNANKKMEPLSLHSWMNMLHRSPAMDLIVLNTSDVARRNLFLQAAYHGIEPHRIRYVPGLQWRVHLQRIGLQCDFALDTFVYGAHTTAADLLWMGTPIVTLRAFGTAGARMPSRVAASIVENTRDPLADVISLAAWLVSDEVKAYEEALQRLLEGSSLQLIQAALLKQSCRSASMDREMQSRALHFAYHAMLDSQLANGSYHIVLCPQYFRPSMFCEAVVDMLSLDGDQLIVDRAAHLMEFAGGQPSQHALAMLRYRLDSQQRDDSMNHNATILKARAVLSSSPPSPSTEDLELVAACVLLTNYLPDLDAIVEQLVASVKASVAAKASGKLPVMVGAKEHQWLLAHLASSMLQALEQDLLQALSLFSNVQKSLVLGNHRDEEKFWFSLVITQLQAILPNAGNVRPFCVDGEIEVETMYRRPWHLMPKEELVAVLHREVFPCFLKSLTSSDLLEQQLFDHFCGTVPLLSQTVLSSAEAMNMLHQLMWNHFMFVRQQRRPGGVADISALQWAALAFLLNPDDPVHFLIMGTHMTNTLLPAGGADWAFLLMIISTNLQFHRTQESDLFIPPSDKKTVAIFCHEYGQSYWPGWGPARFRSQFTLSDGHSTDGRSGMGGSEEAAAQLAHALSAKGYDVTVFASISDEENGSFTTLPAGCRADNCTSRVRWIQASRFPITSCAESECALFDAFISWRYSLSLGLGHNAAKRSYLWLHDRIGRQHLPPVRSLLALCDRVLVQSSSHAQFIAQQIAADDQHTAQRIREHIAVLPNAVYDYSESVDVGQRVLTSFMYASSPTRGLEPLLALWPMIRAALPNAQLHIYYGFTPSVIAEISNRAGMTAEAVQRHMQALVGQPGVIYHGACSWMELALAYRQASFLLYPSIFSETGCIAVMKAMFHGTIPITSRLQGSALASLGGRFDLGPANALNESAASNEPALRQWMQREYLSSVLAAVAMDQEELQEHRTMMMQYAQAFSWEESANIFQTLL